MTRRRSYNPSRGLFAGRRFPSEYAYRKALARRRGLLSTRAARERPIPVFTSQQFEWLTEEQRESYQRSLNVVADMRGKGWSLARAVRENNTDPDTVKRYLGSALRTDTRGRLRPTPFDKRLRRLLVHTETGDKVLDIADSRQATLVADHANALRAFARTGDASGLARFRGRVLQIGKVKYRLVTEPVEAQRIVESDRNEYEIYQRYR